MRREYSSNIVDNYSEYFWVENIGTATQKLILQKTHSSAPNVTLYYSADKSSWSAITASTGTSAYIPINAGQKMYLYGNATQFCNGTIDQWVHFTGSSTSEKYDIGGNIMSLFSGHNFLGVTKFNASYTAHCVGMFHTFNGLVNAEQLRLPVTILAKWSYAHMFQNSKQLQTAPPFDIVSITAKSAMKYCFYGCSALISLPRLFAEDIPQYGYHYLLYGCTSLKKIEMMANGLTGSSSVFNNVGSGSGTIHLKAGTSWNPTSFGMGSGWTVIRDL